MSKLLETPQPHSIQLKDHIKIPLKDIPQMSERDIAYVSMDPSLKSFYSHPPSIPAFSDIIQLKSKCFPRRKITSEYIKKQYEDFDAGEAARENINLLARDNTFTIVTGHQPSLATGPLYFIYKIASVINLCNKLKGQYPDNNFVPVYWQGSEDHDFEEINHFNLFGTRYTWEEEMRGPVGHLPTEAIRSLFPDLFEKLGTSNFAEAVKYMLESSYGSEETLDRATFKLVHSLFKEYGLLIIQANSADLKKEFIPIMEKELFDQVSYPIVSETIKELEEKGFKAQASPREINLFYMTPGTRARIVFENNKYIVLDTELEFTPQEMKTELYTHPERFSPNVIMRPIYQEFLLPNLAYVGGGGEIAYWLERKKQFEAFGIPFPMLVRRSSALWIDKVSSKKMEKLSLSVEDVFDEEESLIKTFLHRQSDSNLEFPKAHDKIKEAFQIILKTAQEVDPTLSKTVKAEQTAAHKSIDQLKGRLIKAEKKNQDIAVNQIRGIKEKLFPGQGLQERSENFLTFFLKHGPEWINLMVESLDPLSGNMYIFRE